MDINQDISSSAVGFGEAEKAPNQAISSTAMPENQSLSSESLKDENKEQHGLPSIAGDSDEDDDAVETSRLFDLRKITIRKAELMAEVYKPWYWRGLLLFCAFLIGYGYGLNTQLFYSYTPYALSELKAAQLTSTLSVVNAVIGAATQLGYSRVADLVGRFYVMVAATIFYVIGLIVMSQATDVSRYAVGSVFYTLGYDGIVLLVVLIMSDASSLKWRLIFISVATWPYIINNWISKPIVDAAKPFIGTNWKWDIAMWAFIFPLSALPFACCILHQWWLASRTPEWITLNEKSKAFTSTLTFKKVLSIIFWEFDILGSFLVAIVLGCILVPITLAHGYTSKWQKPHILAPFVLGFVLLPILLFWEGKYAKFPLIPWLMVKDRGLWAAMGVSFFVTLDSYIVVNYLYEVLIINVNQGAGMADTISGLNTFASTAFAPIFFFAATFMTRLKPTIIAGIGLWFVEVGLLYHFRIGEGARAGIIAARVIGGLGTTMITDPINVSAMAAVSHVHMATATALCYTTYRIGSAVGSAVGGAITTQHFYKNLLKYGLSPAVAQKVYSSSTTLISRGQFPWGSADRMRIMQALADVQWILCVVSLVLLAPMMFFAICLRDPKLTHDQSNKIGRGQIIDRHTSDPIFDFFVAPFRKLARKSRKTNATEAEAQQISIMRSSEVSIGDYA